MFRMQLRQIEVFHAFMITGSTVAAAAMLNVTQPAISTTLKRMQDQLRLPLFQLVRGRLLPTPEAQVLFKQVRAIHEDIGQLERLARTLSEGLLGFIRFGAVPAISERISARAIAQLRDGAPNVQVAMDVLNSHELIDRLRAGRLDIACVFGEADDLPLAVLERFEIELMCVVPEEFPGTSPSVELRELANFPVAAMRPSDPIGRYMAAAFRGSGIKLEPVVELRSCRAAIALAREGVAVGIADRISLSEVQMGTARAVHLSPPMKIPMIIATAEGHIVSIAEKRFVAALKEQIFAAL
jgi:DNA-binding transcriptional LysR family regulator